MKKSIVIFAGLTFLSLATGCSTNQNGIEKTMPDLAQNQIANPLWEGDFPDPHVLRVNEGWVAYATGVPGYSSISVSFSKDFKEWTPVKDALPDRPDWQPITQGLTWAPDVSIVNGRYLMFYVARDQASGLQCITRAWADDPMGPFIDDSTEPFLCQKEQGGTIDPHLFVDTNGKKYLYFKNDGNAVGVPTIIWAAEVDSDGDLKQVARDTGLRNFRDWHGAIVEAPAVFQVGKKYFLTYSGNNYDSEAYAIGWASSDSPMGPWSDQSLEPLLSSFGLVAGPGGQQIFKDDDQNLWIAYHAWTYGKVGYGNGAGNQRSFRVERLELKENQLSPILPSTAPIEKPVTR
ncbi:MAG: hypothetical protein RLZZ277_398 [Actinomycetota bacterium]|jgi:beta-xylosidase